MRADMKSHVRDHRINIRQRAEYVIKDLTVRRKNDIRMSIRSRYLDMSASKLKISSDVQANQNDEYNEYALFTIHQVSS